MTEFENVIIEPLIKNGTIVFSKRYVDDTIVLAKPLLYFDRILKQFNSFHPQIQFTIDQSSHNDILGHTNPPQSTVIKLTLDNINISPVILHGQERLPGYL